MEDSRCWRRNRLAALPVEGCCCGRFGVSGWVGAQGRTGQGRAGNCSNRAEGRPKCRRGRTGTGTGPVTVSVTGDGYVTVWFGLGLLELGTLFSSRRKPAMAGRSTLQNCSRFRRRQSRGRNRKARVEAKTQAQGRSRSSRGGSGNCQVGRGAEELCLPACTSGWTLGSDLGLAAQVSGNKSSR